MATSDTDDQMLLLMRVGQVRFAVPALATDGIAPLPERVAALPGRAASVAGVFERGGHAVALVDLRTKLGLPAEARSGRVVLGTVSGQRFGFAVDEVLGLLRRSEASTSPLPAELSHGHFSEALLAGDQIVLRTELAHLLTLDNIGALKRMAASRRIETELDRSASATTTDKPPITEATRMAGATPDTSPLQKEPATLTSPPPAPLSVKGRPASGTATSTRQPANTYRPGSPSGKGTPASSHPPAAPVLTQGGVAMTPPHRSAPDPLAPLSNPASAPLPCAISPAAEKKEARWSVWPLMVLALAVIGLLSWGLAKWANRPAPAVAALATPVPPLIPAQVKPPVDPPTVQPVMPTPPVQISETQVQWETTPRGMALVLETPKPENREVVHVVVAGDTLWAIAKRYFRNPLVYRDLARQSDIDNPDLIHPGDRVFIVFRGRGNTP